ncbi:MAG: ABC transporter ATP-binding protein, partial [Acidobacteriota bacterium]
MNELKRLLKYVRPFWLTFLFAIITMVLTAVFETATGVMLLPIFNQFIPGKQSSPLPLDIQALIPQDNWLNAWIIIAGLLVTFTICKGISEFFSSYLMAKIGQAAILNLRVELYDHLLNQSAAFFERHRTNFLVSRLVVSSSAIEQAVSANLRDVLREGFMLIFFFGAAFYFNWRLMLGTLIIAPVMGLLTSKFSRGLRRLATEAFEGNKLLTDTAQETLANQTIVKAYHAEGRERSRFAHVAEIIAKANRRAGRLAAISPPIIDIVGVLTIAVLFFFGLREINGGRMDAAQFFTFLFFLFRSYDPMRKISRQHNEISKAFSAAKDVWDVLDENDVLPEKANAVELGPLREQIRLDSVSFVYQNGDKQILNGVDLTIPRGSVVALVGESGGGKSSLIKLVQRLYDPTSGAIYWDDTDLREARLFSLKKQIALVTQETVLFNDTILYNISYGKPEATEAEIAEAARIAFADEFIDGLPQKYQTL